jgi:sugar lactone lactonase YvrE
MILVRLMAGLVFFCMIASSRGAAVVYNWTTLAGVATVIGGTDGTNSNALFYEPYGVVLDGSNIYVADLLGDTIRKMTHAGTNWVVTTIAGSFTNVGYADGVNSAALFNSPRGLVVATNGNIFISDTLNAVIRMLTPVGTNWVSSTIAGSVTNYAVVDGTNGNARFEDPDGMIQDGAGNLYVAEFNGDVIRKLTPSGTNWVVSTIAGVALTPGSSDGIGSAARFNNPYDVAIDSNGNLFVTDFLNKTIRKLTPVGTNWMVSTIAGSAGQRGHLDGTNSNARFRNPTGVTMDSSGNLYVTDTDNDTIRKIVPAGTNWVVSTIGGQVGVTDAVSNDGTNSMALFNAPRGIKVDGHGNLFVADFDHATIRLGTPLIPAMASISLSGTNLMVNGINGLAGGTYYVFATTNAALPLSQWTPVATNVLNATGNFTFTATNAVNPNSQQQFYILQLQ